MLGRLKAQEFEAPVEEGNGDTVMCDRSIMLVTTIFLMKNSKETERFNRCNWLDRLVGQE